MNKFKGLKETILSFRMENKAVFNMNIISIIIIFSYSVTNIFPKVFVEWFTGADYVYGTLSNIALSCIAATIFFIIQAYIPNLHKNKLRKKDLAKDLIYIMELLQYMHGYIQLWNNNDIDQNLEYSERFAKASDLLENQYNAVIKEIEDFKAKYYDISSEWLFDYLYEMQRDPDLKMFDKLSEYKDVAISKKLCFSVKTIDILFRYIIEFQKMENGWLGKEDAERLNREFTYRHLSLNGMMCSREEFEKDWKNRFV